MLPKFGQSKFSVSAGSKVSTLELNIMHLPHITQIIVIPLSLSQQKLLALLYLGDILLLMNAGEKFRNLASGSLILSSRKLQLMELPVVQIVCQQVLLSLTVFWKHAGLLWIVSKRIKCFKKYVYIKILVVNVMFLFFN